MNVHTKEVVDHKFLLPNGAQPMSKSGLFVYKERDEYDNLIAHSNVHFCKNVFYNHKKR